MSVLISGMDMPKSCAECRFFGEYCYAKGDENKYSKFPCPLVSVPAEITEDAINDAHNEGYDVGYWAERRDYEPKWIPVAERLPEDGAEVWVITEMLSEVTRARWHKDTNLWCHPYSSDCLLVLRPIAWMEMTLPEPYREEAEDAEVH